MLFGLRYPHLLAGLILVDSDPACKRLWERYPERLRKQSAEEMNELLEIGNVDVAAG